MIRWVSRRQADPLVRGILDQILAAPPMTEEVLGQYEFHDFAPYHFVRNGFSPRKILFLARRAFKGRFGDEQLRSWLGVFLSRFFYHQFKRSCLPCGPKVGTVTLSPRGDWRMPDEASVDGFLQDLDLQEGLSRRPEMPYDENATSDESICVGCGCPESKFPPEQGRGFVAKTGDIYCCQDCSEGKVCSCNPERAREAG